jgi:hypothetical protein
MMHVKARTLARRGPYPEVHPCTQRPVDNQRFPQMHVKSRARRSWRARCLEERFTKTVRIQSYTGQPAPKELLNQQCGTLSLQAQTRPLKLNRMDIDSASVIASSRASPAP